MIYCISLTILTSKSPSVFMLISGIRDDAAVIFAKESIGCG